MECTGPEVSGKKALTLDDWQEWLQAIKSTHGTFKFTTWLRYIMRHLPGAKVASDLFLELDFKKEGNVSFTVTALTHHREQRR